MTRTAPAAVVVAVVVAVGVQQPVQAVAAVVAVEGGDRCIGRRMTSRSKPSCSLHS